MDCVSPILNAATCLWDRSSKYRVYFCDLEQNLESLRGAMISLKAISEDVKTRVQVEEQQQMIRRTNQVSAWLQSVEDMEKEVNEIQERGVEEIQNKCVRGCGPKNCRSTYKLGKIVINKFNSVNQLLEQRERFDVIAARLPLAPVEEKPVGKTVGSDSMLEKVWRWIRDRLHHLPELKSICRHALPFHSLTVINLGSCPKLKKLPLDSNSAKNSLKKISAEKEWWDELEWDDDSTRLHFLPYLVPIVS